jgi:hypothetical protein
MNGWLLIQQFCTSESIDTEPFEANSNPALLFADLFGNMKEKQTSNHLRSTARPARQWLLDVLGDDVKLASNSWSNTLFNNASSKVEKSPKGVTIW